MKTSIAARLPLRYLLWLLPFLLLSFSTLKADSTSYFSSQLAKAKPGDYFVTSQPGNYSILLVRDRENTKIILEEIDVPDYAVNGKKTDWKTWVASKAPGHSAWTLLEIDLSTVKLTQAYSLTKRCFLHVSLEEQFLMQLLGLPTKKLTVDERRKVGAAPLPGEEDHRSIWQPAICIEGTQKKDPTSVYRAEWPHDRSLLSGCRIDLFFDDKLADFPFPVWVEIYSGHFKTRLAVLEVGRELISPAPGFPPRPPEILSMPKKSDDTFVVKVHCPVAFDQFELYALEASGPLKPGIRLLHHVERIDAETVQLVIPSTIFDDRLEIGHRYRLAIVPSGHRNCYTETTETFLVTP